MRYILVILFSIFIIGCSVLEEDTEEKKEPSEETDLPVEDFDVIATELQEPWEIVLYDDVFYISERGGAIVTVKDGEQHRKAVQLERDLSNQPEAGLLGIAFPNDFNGTAYAYYSYHDGDAFYQRVVKIKELDNQWEEVETLIDHIPGGQYHQGGRIEIGPDQKLYITTGDASNPELSQDLTSLAGKILRMNLDGSIPRDNPFEDSYVFSYGHRNPQGLAWIDNELYATEHGDSAHDEINRIKGGNNYGWPIIQGDQEQDGMETPVVHAGEDTWAPSGLAFYKGKLYFASLRGEALRKLNLETMEVDTVISDVGRVRDVLATETGLYLITNNTDGRGDPTEDDDRLLFIQEIEN
ncbi:quinoprotein glucose dehydrogenase [Ornithinibacillus sp. L9]|uniref:Quinoprotein glucose dehydrogenase n=1 Tax=Ornithinibacillus caprae TaxID=2678566 RepID=A0A6N8FJW1_9BACI|nr:quinoprotein glucose dehydrogenase [Ornithinibacillus caprae]